MKYFKISISILALVILIFLAVQISGTRILPNLLGANITGNTSLSTSTDETLLSQRAPSFDLPDLSGNSVSLSKFINTPTILIFWSTWDQASIDQVKIVDDYLRGGNKDTSLVSFLAIDSQEDQSVVKSLIKRGGYAIPFALDTYGDVSNSYHIKSLPTVYFIDRGGVVREIYAGILSQNMLVNKAEQIMK